MVSEMGTIWSQATSAVQFQLAVESESHPLQRQSLTAICPRLTVGRRFWMAANPPVWAD